MPCSLLHLSSQIFQNTPLVKMRVRRTLAERNVPTAQSEEEEDIEPLSAKMARLEKEAAGKRAMGSSSAGRGRRKATAGRPVKRPVDISSGSGSDFGSDSTVPEAEEENSYFSDEE
jgi:hypothetical protein